MLVLRRLRLRKDAALVALLTCLLRWPDHGQASCFVHGFPIVGEVSFSGVFRPLSAGLSDEESVEGWLARDGAQAVRDLMRSSPPKNSQEILRLTLQEQEQGFCSELLTKEQIDRLFGIGKWRPMERFLLVQGDNKKRLVDNCRKTEHNAHAQLHETIFTVFRGLHCFCNPGYFASSGCQDISGELRVTLASGPGGHG